MSGTVQTETMAPARVRADQPTKRRGSGRLARRESLAAVVFVSPSLILFIVFSAGPAIFSIAMGFMDWNGLGAPRWVGVANYRELLGDALFGRSLINTLFYTLCFVVLTTISSIAIALLLARRFRGVGAVRFLWFLPFVTDMISVSLVWGWLYHPQFGILNYILGLVHVPPQSWLGDSRWAMISLVVLSAWRWSGYYAVILVAALQAVPKELEEAAIVDGAGGWSVFRHVKLPQISPALFLVVTLEIMSSLQVFEQMWVLTNGGPDDSTISMAMYLYLEAFKFLRMGYASAVAWVLFLLILIITLVNWWARRYWTHED